MKGDISKYTKFHLVLNPKYLSSYKTYLRHASTPWNIRLLLSFQIFRSLLLHVSVLVTVGLAVGHRVIVICCLVVGVGAGSILGASIPFGIWGMLGIGALRSPTSYQNRGNMLYHDASSFWLDWFKSNRLFRRMVHRKNLILETAGSLHGMDRKGQFMPGNKFYWTK